MSTLINPALEAFLSELGDGIMVAQVRIRPVPGGFELRHAGDQEAEASALVSIKLEDARPLAQSTAQGQFRPLKSAPNLPNGWRMEVSQPSELGLAIDTFYPGFLPDWHAIRTGSASPAVFEEFISRQTGMYLGVRQLSQEQASFAIRAGCHRRFCLKQRLWTAQETPPDAASDKSIIPCLEPCPLLLEFTRHARNLEEEAREVFPVHSGETATLRQALQSALDHPDPSLPEADFSAPANPRRYQMILEKLLSHPSAPAPPGAQAGSQPS